MYYCVVHYPNTDTSKIEQLRKKYDPTSGNIQAHLTLVFPFKTDSVQENVLKNHIQTVANNFPEFSAQLKGFEKSWDNWLFLSVEEGNEQFIKLHDELYKGILEPYLRRDLPFSPHVSLGLFMEEGSGYTLKNLEAGPLNAEKYGQALKEAKELNLDYEVRVGKLTLIKLNDDLSEIIESTDFALASS